MARPNFSLVATIKKLLHGVTLSQHTVNNCLMPDAICRQVVANKRIWTFDAYDHAVNVHVPGYGVFEFRWNTDSAALDSLSRRWLATQVYYFKQRNPIEHGKAA